MIEERVRVVIYGGNFLLDGLAINHIFNLEESRTEKRQTLDI